MKIIKTLAVIGMLATASTVSADELTVNPNKIGITSKRLGYSYND